MLDLEKTLYDLCLPLTSKPEALSVKTMASANDKETLLYVYADDADIARLIGRKGAVAGSIRSMMSAAARSQNQRILVKFEAY
ncbi:MAG: KH domain-containing protein [Allobaculum sp.]